jgi:protease I
LKCSFALCDSEEIDMAARLAGMKVAILVTDGFEQVELTKPREALHRESAITLILSDKDGEVLGMNHIDKADKFKVDAKLKDVNPEDYDAVLLPGGVVNADALRIVPEAQKFIKVQAEDGKPVAVICHGPWLLVSAGLVRNRTLTSWPSLQDDIRNAGGKWVDEEVCVDGNWASSRKPDDIPAFNAAMVELFAEHSKRWAKALERNMEADFEGTAKERPFI